MIPATWIRGQVFEEALPHRAEMEVSVRAQNEISRVASAGGPKWVKVRELWADKAVRDACGDEATLLDSVLRMHIRALLVAGLLDGRELVVWASDQPPRANAGVTFRA